MRTIAYTQYTVYDRASDPEEADTRAQRVERLLRFALELSLARPVWQDTTNLWLTIDISEEYPVAQPVEGSASDSPSPEKIGSVCEESTSSESQGLYEYGDVAPSATHRDPGLHSLLNPGATVSGS